MPFLYNLMDIYWPIFGQFCGQFQGQFLDGKIMFNKIIGQVFDTICCSWLKWDVPKSAKSDIGATLKLNAYGSKILTLQHLL
jgi:hypothetical protein